MAEWKPEAIETLSSRYGIRHGIQLHAGAEDYHFPERNFLADGYAPPGGYVKDFSVVRADGRLHLFHIDGRPGEVCWVTGNEISFGHASTADYCQWIRHPMPLAVGDRAWENEHVWAPYIYRHAGLYYLFYMGGGKGGTFISYATSTDLERWTRWPEGPIRCAIGRDPFVFDHGDQTVLFYTGHTGARILACASRDRVRWEPLPEVLFIPNGADDGAAESCSLHPLGDRYVLWFNDYRSVKTHTGVGFEQSHFRAAYALSDDPFHFDAATIREFRFVTDSPDAAPSPELPVRAPVPLGLELIAADGPRWFISYFRWHGDRNRLFFGELDWTCEPAVIREITSEKHLSRGWRPDSG